MILTCLSITMSCLVAASGLSYSINKVDEIKRVKLGSDFTLPVGEQTATSSKAKNFLLVGIDSNKGLDPNDPVNRGRSNELNSDTLIILRVDPERKTAAMLSLPRDLWVSIGGPNNAKGKINTALSTGGAPLLVKTIVDTLRIPIQHYVQIDLAGFKDLIGAINGVPMQFRYPTRDQATGLFQYDPGCVNLDPDQGLAFARSRKMEVEKNGVWQSDGGDDRARAKRQQEFIRAAIKKALSQGARNPAVLASMINIALEKVEVDGAITPGDLIELGATMRDFDPAEIQSYEPFTTEGYAGDAAVLYLQETDSQPTFEIFRGHDPLVDIRPFVRVEVRNATTERDKASLVGLELATNGFTLTSTRDDTGYRNKPTRILYATDKEKISAVILARYLNNDVVIEQGSIWGQDARVALIVGSDYAGVRSEPRPLTDFRAYLPKEMFPDESGSAEPTGPVTIPFEIPTSTVVGEIPDAPVGCV